MINTIAATLGFTGTVTYTDNAVSADTAYLYKVRALTSGIPSIDSNTDLATTTLFPEALVAGSTTIKASHMDQIRTAINAVHVLALLGSVTFTDASLAGVVVKSGHITQARGFLDEARAALSLPALSYAQTLTPNVSSINAGDFTELRNGVK